MLVMLMPPLINNSLSQQRVSLEELLGYGPSKMVSNMYCDYKYFVIPVDFSTKGVKPMLRNIFGLAALTAFAHVSLLDCVWGGGGGESEVRLILPTSIILRLAPDYLWARWRTDGFISCTRHLLQVPVCPLFMFLVRHWIRFVHSWA